MSGAPRRVVKTKKKDDSLLSIITENRKNWTFSDLLLAVGVSILLTFAYLKFGGQKAPQIVSDYNSTELFTARFVEGGWTEFDITVVTDLDTESKESSGKKWSSTGRRGVLSVSANGKAASVKWNRGDFVISSALASGGRAMELSDLAVFDGKLITVDDRTGILYRLQGNQVFPWVLLNDGPGNTSKTLKGEWMTVKDEKLIVGGLGKEWTTTAGEYVNDNPMWIKEVDRNGAVTHIPWKDVFVKVRRAAGIEYPGYMIHEAVQWSSEHHKWFFLPRRISKETYSEEADETRGSNLMIIADEHFDNFKVITIGKLEDPARGFSAFQFIPHTKDNLIIALKSAEKDGVPSASYITVFDIYGNIILNDQSLQEAHKFEGIAFV